MKLSLLHEYFDVVGGYPNSIVKGKKKRGKNDLRFHTHPEQRSSYLKWLSGKRNGNKQENN